MAREDSGGRVSPRKSLEAVAVDPGTDRSGGIDQPRKSGEISDEEILDSTPFGGVLCLFYLSLEAVVFRVSTYLGSIVTTAEDFECTKTPAAASVCFSIRGTLRCGRYAVCRHDSAFPVLRTPNVVFNVGIRYEI